MTPFSSVLEFYMKEKEIKTYAIAQFCGIDRSNMYKLINGKRTPSSDEVVEKIAEYMRLKPTEKNRLREAYEITIVGYDTYHRRKSVQEFLRSFSRNHLDFEKTQPWQETVVINEYELRMFHGMVMAAGELEHLVFSILNVERQKPGGRVCLLMQPEDRYIMDVLAYIGAGKRDLRIEHIFCLNNTNNMISQKEDYNLDCLKHILPMFIRCGCDYRPYCYYDNIASRNNRFNLLSSMILTSEYAIVFSLEEKYGILLSEKNTIEHMDWMFQSLKKETFLMAKKMNSFEKQLKTFENMNFNEKGVDFQPEGCLIPMIPSGFPEKYLNFELLWEPKLMERVSRYVLRSAQTQSSAETMYIFTEKGIRTFARTGQLSELPDSVCRPLEYEDRMLLIRKLISECRIGKYQMLRPDAPVADAKLCLYSGRQEGYLLLEIKGEQVFIEIRETGLLFAFRDYFETLDRRYFYNADEAVKLLKDILKVKPA